jgi:signal transduction histidine kinase
MGWFFDHVTLLSRIDGLVEAIMAFVLLTGVRARVGRLGPLAWLVAGYFLVEAGVSLNRSLVDSDFATSMERIILLELLGTVLIVLMLARASHIARAIAYTIDEARMRAREYERARRDYTQVVRHRIANPLTVIKGAAQTLEAGELDEATRHDLRVAIIAAAEQLEAISLEPERAGDEEHELDAIPRVPARPAARRRERA